MDSRLLKKYLLRNYRWLGYILIGSFFYAFVIHESAHAAVCWLGGGSPSYILQNYINPGIFCANFTPSPWPNFFRAMMPYIVDIFLITGLAFIQRRSLPLQLLPHIAFFNTAANAVFGPIMGTRSDFVRLAANLPDLFWYGYAIAAATMFAWACLYRKDILTAKRAVWDKA